MAKSKYRPKKDDDRMTTPRPYDLSKPEELDRLHNELEGYMRVSLKDGTDTEGRAYAYAALVQINQERRLSKKPETALFGIFEPSV